MNSSERAVTIKEVPLNCNNGDANRFVQDLAHDIAQVMRPAVVLDCSSTHGMDRRLLNLLFCCLEEAIKRNGDVRLVGLHQDAWKLLKSTGADRLFRNFATIPEAVDSYRIKTSGRTAFAAESETGEPAAA